jgi:hypothetical protein
MAGMDAQQVEFLREALAGTGWVDRTRSFARSVRDAARVRESLLLIGTPEEEPWHLAAHLTDEARWANAPELAPTLVRWVVPSGAPQHLATSLQRLEAVSRGEAVFVVSDEVGNVPLLERTADARRRGATVLALDTGDKELVELAHDSLSVSESDLVVPELSFDTVQHFVSTAAGEVAHARTGGFRDRLSRMLDAISGPAHDR